MLYESGGCSLYYCRGSAYQCHHIKIRYSNDTIIIIIIFISRLPKKHKPIELATIKQ